MDSLLERMASLGHRVSSATAPGGGGRGRGAPDPPRRAAALQQAAALRQRMAATRERVASSNPAVASARPLAEQNLSRRGQVQGLDGQFRDLESQLQQARSVQLCKESKHKLAAESIPYTTATNEQLHNSVIDTRTKRDERRAIISNELQALEALEAKRNEDATLREDIEEALSWFDRSLGFQVLGGKGVKLVFNKIDPQHPEKEYSICIKLDDERYNLLQCDPSIKELGELMKDLNLSDDMVKFVRIIREKFHASSVNGILPVSSAVCPEVSATPFSIPAMTSAYSRTEDVPNQSHSRSKEKKQSLPAKRRATALWAASPASLRRSPRLEAMR